MSGSCGPSNYCLVAGFTTVEHHHHHQQHVARLRQPMAAVSMWCPPGADAIGLPFRNQREWSNYGGQRKSTPS
jgi:hypothetical protein